MFINVNISVLFIRPWLYLIQEQNSPSNHKYFVYKHVYTFRLNKSHPHPENCSSLAERCMSVNKENICARMKSVLVFSQLPNSFILPYTG